jgi:hypothetical protein
MPSARHRRERRHLVDVIAEETRVSGTPDASGVPDNKATRTTRGGETVKRATFWFAEKDLETIARLQRVLNLPGVSGVPDKSAVVREAIRRLSTDLLTADSTDETTSEMSERDPNG